MTDRRRRGGTTTLATAAGAAVLMTVTMAGCGAGGSSGGTPRSGGTLKVSMSSALTELDPAKGSANAMAQVGVAIYDTLMKVQKVGDKPTPHIAKSLTASDDLKTWTMKLPAGVQFSDGTPFDADAVKFNMDRHLDPKTASTAASLLSSVASVRAPDAETVVFKLKYPFANFPYTLAFDGSGTAGYIASPAALKKYGKDYTAHAAGLGPFKLESWAPGKPVTLVRNPNYWNKNQKIRLDKVVISTIADEQAQYQALQSGTVDVASSIDPTVQKQAKANSSLNYEQGVGSDQNSIALNMDQPPFNDPRARQAVSKALNRPEIVALTKEGLTGPAVNLFPKGDPFHNPAADPGFDLAGAKALVQQYEQATGRPFEFTYTCRAVVNETQVIERQLAAAGMKLKIEIQEGATALETFFGQKYQATCWSMAGFLTPDLLPYRFFHSSGDLNNMGFKDKRFDAAADAARRTADPAEQKRLWAEADTVLAEQLPWVWTTGQPVAYISRKTVHSPDLDEPSRLRGRIVEFDDMWLSS
ncbi:ABC transporter substrate-binding protein [Actinomadura sp. 1N219]|uniref:ABC transporter substrate-binding protein n=1 Tax=Actinomadura sp. 1N219 TaxID=3375152 RepID=UPI0037A1FAE5